MKKLISWINTNLNRLMGGFFLFLNRLFNVRSFEKVLITLTTLSFGAYSIKLGIDFHDSFYFILSGFALFIIVFLLLRNDRMSKIKVFIPSIAPISNPLNLIKEKGNNLGKRTFNQKTFTRRLLSFALLPLVNSYLILYQLPSTTHKGNIFKVVFLSLYDFFKNQIFIFIIFVIGVFIFQFIIAGKSKSKTVILRSIISSITSTILSLIISAPLALLYVIIIVIILFNTVIIYSKISPTILKIYTEKNDIKNLIESSEKPVAFVGFSNSPQKTYIQYSSIIGKGNGLFANTIIPAIPNEMLLNSPLLNKSLYLINNTMVIKEIDKDIFQSFAPSLVKKFVKRSIPSQYIKNEPDVFIISRQEYLKYRDDQINEEIDEISGYIDEIQKTLNTIGYNIKVAKDNIATLQGYIDLNTQLRDKEYNDCISATWTYYGYYANYTYRRYTDQYCQNLRASRDRQNDEYRNEIASNQKSLSFYQTQYGEVKGYLDQFQNYQVFIKSTKELTPYELGLFEPPRSVKVVLDSANNKDITAFLETLTHEYIHYTSYVSEERSLPLFFEEGITEYLARKVISDQLKSNTEIGYPIVVKVINAMSTKIPISRLEDIYFKKNSDELITLLDNTYGKNFYEDTKIYFALIPYSPSEEALKFANNIMFKIGAQEITEQEIGIED